MSYSPKNPNGQETMANSEPVVIASDQSAVPVSAASLPLPSGAATSAKQDTGNTSLATLAGAVSGTEMQVDIVSLPAVDTELTTADLDTGAGTDTRAVVGLVGSKSGGAQLIPGDATAGLKVDLGADNDVTVTGTVTVDGSGVTQPVSHAALTELAAAINVSSQLDVNIAASGATVPVSNAGLTALNGAIAGTEVQVDVVGPLPAGTNAIGKLAANSGVDIGDVDVTSLPALAAGTNAIGKLLPPDVDVTTHTNYARKYYTNAGAVTDGIIWSPAAGKRWHVVTMYIQTSAAATITLEDDKAGGDDPVWKGELAANSGVTLSFTEKYPMASGEDAADLIITTSAGNVYVTCVGFEI